MIDQLERNSNRDPNGYRYEDKSLERLALVTWIIGGRRLYEIYAANFIGIFPQPRIIERKLTACEELVTEGDINAIGLFRYLIENDCPLVVCVSEDATAVESRPEYCSKRNAIIGMNLPLINGVPDASYSVVNTAVDIVKLCHNYEKATNAIVIMAQPLSDAVPPFRLCCFGTDNRYTASDVQSRHAKVEEELKKYGIILLTFAADGDSREMKVMRSSVELGLNVHDFSKILFYFSLKKL